jgi:hypothetical protein
MMTIAALLLAYGLVKIVPDHSESPTRPLKQYGTDDPAEWARELHGPVLHVIDGGAGHE